MAGVSGATVSRAFNSPELVTDIVREKVLNAARELGYHPNRIAGNFARGISGNIGVIIPQIPNIHIFSVYYFSELLSGIGEALSEYGYDLVLFFHKVEENRRNDYKQYFTGGKVDGCILLGTYSGEPGLIELKEYGCKFCLVNNYIKGSGISFIDVDNISGSYEAVSYLINLGHRKIAFLNGPADYTNSADRLRGYHMALGENGITINHEYILEGNYGRKSGYRATDRLLSLNEPPTAVFCGNDRMAAGLIQGLKEKGFRIPQDFSIAGYDDSDTAAIIDPQLTTVRIPFFDMGKRCVFELLKLVKSKKNDEFGIFIKPELIVRASCGNI